jgi:hypothetical protein
MASVLWVAAALLFSGAMIYIWMKAGSRHIEAEPVPKVD